MPARKGWLQVVAEELYWAIYDHVEPELRRRFYFSIHEGRAYVFCEGHPPHAVLEVINEDFFRSYNIRTESWEPVFRLPWEKEEWVSYDPARHAHSPVAWFGWRFHESLILPEDGSAPAEEMHKLYYVKTPETS